MSPKVKIEKDYSTLEIACDEGWDGVNAKN